MKVEKKSPGLALLRWRRGRGCLLVAHVRLFSGAPPQVYVATARLSGFFCSLLSLYYCYIFSLCYLNFVEYNERLLQERTSIGYNGVR